MIDPAWMPERLAAFLGPVLGPEVRVESYEQVLGGFSRLTARFRCSVDGGPSRTLILRGDPPPERETTRTDRGVEFRVMSALYRAGTVPLPEPLALDESGTALGTPAMVMEDVPGRSLLHEAAATDAAWRPDLAMRLVDLAVRIHTVDTASLPELDRARDWDGYIDGCIAAWREIERGHPESDPFIRYLAAWLDEHRPPPAPLTLVHGDFHAGNILVSPDGKLTAVDWEFSRIADPREDLGWFTAIGASMPPDLVSEEIDVFCAEYRELTGLGADLINPWTISYFQILSGANLFGGVMAQASSLARGEVRNVKPIYVTGFIVTGHQAWFHGPQSLESALRSAPEPTLGAGVAP